MGIEDLDLDGITADLSNITEMVNKITSGEEVNEEFIAGMDAALAALESKVPTKKEK